MEPIPTAPTYSQSRAAPPSKSLSGRSRAPPFSWGSALRVSLFDEEDRSRPDRANAPGKRCLVAHPKSETRKSTALELAELTAAERRIRAIQAGVAGEVELQPGQSHWPASGNSARERLGDSGACWNGDAVTRDACRSSSTSSPGCLGRGFSESNCSKRGADQSGTIRTVNRVPLNRRPLRRGRQRFPRIRPILAKSTISALCRA